MFFPAKCDFCGQRPVPWTYPANDFEVTISTDEDEFTFERKGGWDACDACHLLIEAEDWEGLAKRAQAHDPIPGPGYIYFGLYLAFQKNRTGPAEPQQLEEAQ